jgi:hypothetical protein
VNDPEPVMPGRTESDEEHIAMVRAKVAANLEAEERQERQEAEAERRSTPMRSLGGFLRQTAKSALSEAAKPVEKFKWRSGGQRRVKAERPTARQVTFDGAPGVRHLRKHKRQGAPTTYNRCACTGCQCGRISRFGMPCHPCSRGRHVRSGLGKTARRRAEHDRIITAAAQISVDGYRGLAANHRAMAERVARRRR